MSIEIVRIDDRLIHGKVAMQWVQAARANVIVIVDDDTANDSFMTTICKRLAPVGTSAEVYTQKKSIQPLLAYQQSKVDRILILTKGPKEILYLVEHGIAVPELVVGGMGIKQGRTTIEKALAASEEERAIFKKLDSLGTRCVLRSASKGNARDLMDFL